MNKDLFSQIIKYIYLHVRLLTKLNKLQQTQRMNIWKFHIVAKDFS